MKTIFIITIISILTFSGLLSKNVELKTAKKAAENHIVSKAYNFSHSIIETKEYFNFDEKLFYLFELSPAGYIIVSADNVVVPVVAFSFLNNIDSEGRFIKILKTDVALRKKHNSYKKSLNNLQKWQEILSVKQKDIKGQIWPPPGSTPTGGWLESNWTQNAPYNNMCPMDPVNVVRSLAGCPAVAMAMIVNYHKTTNNTYFDDNDDYYHNYSGRQYWIDDDYLTIEFPSFPELNNYLDTINYNYQNSIPETNQDKSALVFACAIACTQVFTSSASGTFGVSQAYSAYQNFNFNTIDILYDGDTTIYSRLIQNIIDSLPAHLALVDSAWSMGHNVVVDGYDSNGFFHINFGWGGSNNGWYTLPDGIPYSLTVIEGLIIDIIPQNSTNINIIDNKKITTIYPNPTIGKITIQAENIIGVEVMDITGKTIIKHSRENGNPEKWIPDQVRNEIDLSQQPKGIYIIKVTTNKGVAVEKIVLSP